MSRMKRAAVHAFVAALCAILAVPTSALPPRAEGATASTPDPATMHDREPYLHLLREANPQDLAFGLNGIEIVSAEGLDEAQLGYSIHPDGHSLSGAGEGDWRDSWLVIATDGLTGDPLFIDLAQPDLPVFSAQHGMGYWAPNPVAGSARGFFGALRIVAGMAVGRETLPALERNPLSGSERDSGLDEIERLDRSADRLFWESFLSNDL